MLGQLSVLSGIPSKSESEAVDNAVTMPVITFVWPVTPVFSKGLVTKPVMVLTVPLTPVMTGEDVVEEGETLVVEGIEMAVVGPIVNVGGNPPAGMTVVDEGIEVEICGGIIKS